MMQPMRGYQRKAVEAVFEAWKKIRSVCLVAPTGAGKTRICEELIANDDPVLWVAHRRELVIQTKERLAQRFGERAVGYILPGERENVGARVQLSTVQTLVRRGVRPKARIVVLDEAHHYVADEWIQIVKAYPKARFVGPTATPEREDGTPLGDVFERLVVASNYSKLIAEGHLVPARVYRPGTSLGNDLAIDPFDAWAKYSEGSQAFAFCARVEIAEALAQKFRDYGVRAALVEANTPKRERDEVLEEFRRGRVRIITNVNTMTEGVDVPEARTIILARQFCHVGGYIQAVGRGLRPAKGKPDAILVDLTGCSIRHGIPTIDREYSLEGRAISGGREFSGPFERPDFSQEIRNVELEMVARGALASEELKPEVEVRRVDEAERRAEYERLVGMTKAARMRVGFAKAKYHEKFGEWPREDWG